MTIDPLLFAAILLACLLQTCVIAVMALTLPAFAWRCFKLESRVDQHKKELDELDAVVAEMNKALLGPPLPMGSRT